MNQQTRRYDVAEEHPFGDAGQVIFVIGFFVVWIVDSFILKLTTFPAVHVPFLIRALLGICSASLGFALLRTHTAGYIKLGTSVIMNGPYRFIRHPIYASVLLIVLGLALTTLSIAGLTVWLLFFIFYNHISAYEEKILMKKFGKEYADYVKKVPRWIPGIGRKYHSYNKNGENPLSSSEKIIIDIDYCDGCMKCAELCPSSVFQIRDLTDLEYQNLTLGQKAWVRIKGRTKSFVVNPDECLECGECEKNCKEQAIRIAN